MAALGNRAVRQRAMRDMFREVEARWGSLASLVDASLEVETGRTSKRTEQCYGSAGTPH